MASPTQVRWLGRLGFVTADIVKMTYAEAYAAIEENQPKLDDFIEQHEGQPWISGTTLSLPANTECHLTLTQHASSRRKTKGSDGQNEGVTTT